MPIEFACESCTKLLRVPDGTSGSSCQCPACGTLLEIPDPDAVEIVEVVDEDQHRGKLTVSCPKCSFSLVCDPELLGTKGQCRNCKYIFVISQGSAPLGETEVELTGLVFSCPSCDQLFEGTEEMRGRKGKCHECGEVFAIELRKAESSGSQVATEHGGTQAVESPASVRRPDDGKPGIERTVQRKESASVPKKPSPGQSTPGQSTQGQSAAPKKRVAETQVPQAGSAGATPRGIQVASVVPQSMQIACTSCNGVMEVPGSAAGQQTACPYCKQPLQIPVASVPTAPLAESPTVPNVPTSSPVQSVSDSIVQNDVWADLGDLSGAAANPYTVPGPTAWDAADESMHTVRPKVRRGLSFSNVFGLTFEVLFPACLVGCFVYLMMTAFSVAVSWGVSFLIIYVTDPQQLDPWFKAALGIIVSLVLGFISSSITSVGMCMICNGALTAVRKRRLDAGAFFSTDAFPAMFGYFLTLALGGILTATVPAMLAKEAPEVALLLYGVSAIFWVVALLALSLAPIAIVDGYGTLDAMAASAQLFFGNFLVMISVMICGFLMLIGISIVSCGLGAILFSTFPFFLLAASYHLATR